MEHEHLAGEIELSVDAADERADLAARELLDGVAERGDLGVLEQQAQLAQALVLVELAQPALGRRERLLERDDDDVGAGPLRAGLRRPAPELVLVDSRRRWPCAVEPRRPPLALLRSASGHGRAP
jgi:hypothetical protein